MGSSGQETYSFSEAIERIRTCEDLDILNEYGRLLQEEKYNYCLFYLYLFKEALRLQREWLVNEPIH
jgi:hypothetical protein